MLTKLNNPSEQQQRAACSLANWRPTFKKITIRTVSLAIPSEVLDYLRADFFILPRECGPAHSDTDGVARFGNEAERVATSASDSDSGDESDTSHDGGPPTFPAFSAQVRQAISDLGGGVFIKTNWHSPKDAFWITAGQTLRCRDLADVYQLLKASSFCKQDFEADDAEQFLHMRSWLEIHPGTEFRCYVRQRRLIAISPRDWPQYHAYIPAQKRDIINDIRTMFVEHIKQKFTLSDFCFDVVRDQKDNVWLMDFAPYGKKCTEALAFEWSELDELHDDRVDTSRQGESVRNSDGHDGSDEDIDEDASTDEDDPEFRYLTEDTGIQPSKRNNYGIPKDVIDVYRSGASEATGGVADEGRCTLNDLLFRQLRGLSDRETDE